MVNCDECGVWVHTRCSRFVRGEKSFACDKCKSKPNRNDSEETEVAQLLVELPTKTIKLNNPYPLNNPPARRPYKLWTDRPIEQRVHAQGIPGGDPALFHGFSSIFSSELWKCTGYIPKKFNFCYREFPCWDKQLDINAKAEGDTENPVDKGAGVLYSLSKETVVATRAPTLVSMRSQLKGGGSDKKASKDRKWEGGDSKNSSVQNLEKKEKLRPNVLQCGKRGRDDLAPSKDRSVKKKTKVLHKEDGSKRNKVHSFKAVVIHSTSARQVEEYETKAQKVVKPDALDDKHGLGEDAGSQEVASNAHHAEISNIEKPKNNVATDEGHLTPRSLEVSRIGRVKAEKFGQDASDQTVVVPLPSLENDVIVRNPMNKEGLVLHDVGTNQGLHTEPPTSDILKSKPVVEDVANAALEIRKNLDTNMLLRSAYCNSKTKSAANVDNLKGVPRSRPPNVVANSDGMKDLTERISSADHESNMSQVNETLAPSCQSFEHEGREGDKDLEVSGCQYEKFDETTDSPFNIKLEYEGSESSLEIPKVLSNSKEIPRVAGEMSKMIGSIPPPPPVVSGGKSSSSSSTIVISRSSISDKSRSPQNPTSTGKRMISSSSLSTKKEHASADPIKDENKHEKPKSTVKDNPKSSLNPILKASQPSRASYSPVFKHYTSVGKDSLRHPTSKSTSVESSLLPSGVVEPATSSQTQHTLHVQNKNITPAGQRGEKNHQSNLPSSSKSTQSSLGHLPASSNSPAGLSDEELALLLHQELNSSPRVPRVPRVRHAGSLPQLSSVSATSMLIKRTSSSGGKDQQMFPRRRNKDTHKDGSRSSREQSNEDRKVRLPSSPDSAKASDALTQAEADSELLHSMEKNVECISTSAANSGPSSSNANELKVSSSQDLLLNNPEDDTGTNKGVAPTHRTLPGLIAEIMGKGRRMTYEELCNAVLPHWQSLRKHNGERYAYSSHSQAVLDCLRNRSEWARLVDRGPKTNATRKKRKIDAEPPNTESEDGEDGTFKDGESKSFEFNKEEFPKGRRKAKKGRRLAQQGRGIKDDRKRRKVEIGSDDTGSSSNSRAGSVSSEDESQGSGMCAAKSEVSASSDGLGAVS